MYDETDQVSPTTVYGRQKVEVEEAIRLEFSDYLIFRTSKLMSMDLNPRSILTPLVQNLWHAKPVSVFRDQYISPVFVEDVAEVLVRSIKAGLSGTYHLGPGEQFSRAEIALRVADLLDLDVNAIRPIRMSDIAFSEPRGPNNTLNSEKISRALEYTFTSLEDGIAKLGRPGHKR
jgi:dTDP-4-dehydrorhamnose reductase